ncbi:uncharacterized protein LOC112058529 isoform X1 [Bicyclus anynana]|uniref:Regulatory protein zeste n=1 Tax=Bicyclus anynana TaxID=110368 RepID=A0A6J1P4Q8_BICAN|nr:uncharacterized protein LOC112058529 isoform X1 [Bicyclus anynana]
MVIVFCGKSQKMSFKKQRSNKKQIEVLVEFMSTHNHLATGEFTGPLGGKRADSQWQTLKEMLKEYGPDRSINQWKQTWKDIKNNSRSENAASSRARHTTGNYVNVPVVSDITNKVLSIIGQEASTGIGPEETEIGPYEIFEVPVEMENIPPIPLSPVMASSQPIHSFQPIASSEPIPSSLSTPSLKFSSTPILRKKGSSTETFSKLQEEHNAILKSIDERLKQRNELLSEQNNLLREQNTHLRSRNKIKRNRFTHRFF